MTLLLEKNNYEIVSIEGTFTIDIFLLMGENYIGNEILGRECHSKIKKFEINLIKSNNSQLLTSLYKKLSEINIGREIFIIARKK